MNAEREKMRVEVNSSLMNLFDKSIFYTVVWRVEDFADTAYRAGYAGLEWHPVRAAISGIQVRSGILSPYAKDAVTSAHQSWRGEKSIKEVLTHPNPSFAALSYVLLPEEVSSVSNLLHLQHILGREIPVVLYPSPSLEQSGLNRHFAESLFQPTPKLMRDWGVETPEQLVKEARKRGYSQLCIDTYHLRKAPEDGISLLPWQETLPQLLPYSSEIHVSAGRVDQNQAHIDTEKELKDLLSATSHTDLPQMLKAIATSGWRGRVVTEIPAAALFALRAGRNPVSTPKDLIEDHRRIVDHIKQIFG